jgi:hypothetical protein
MFREGDEVEHRRQGNGRNFERVRHPAAAPVVPNKSLIDARSYTVERSTVLPGGSVQRILNRRGSSGSDLYMDNGIGIAIARIVLRE